MTILDIARPHFTGLAGYQNQLPLPPSSGYLLHLTGLGWARQVLCDLTGLRCEHTLWRGTVNAQCTRHPHPADEPCRAQDEGGAFDWQVAW